MLKLKVGILPDFDHPEKGEGGIRRVVEAQKKYLPDFDIEIVGGDLATRLNGADLLAYHGGIWEPTNKPVVSHSHGMYWKESTWPTWAHEINQKVVNAARQATVVTSPSEWVANIYKRACWIDSPVLYHGIDPAEWSPPDEEPVDIYVLWNKNRVDPICENNTLDELAARSPDTNFVSTFATRNPRPNITVTGRLTLDAMRPYVRGASVYLCNVRETFGIGTLEAMACGVPVLGWRWGGQREIITHGVDGWLSTPGDYDDLFKGLQYCLEHKKKMGIAARKKVLSKFTWQKAMERYARLYKDTYEAWVKEQAGPRVSVIITCYNLAGTLPRAVKSVQNQQGSGTDHEIIIVNDASPDSTATVAAELAASDPKIKVVTNASNLYLAGALNVGIGASTGRYILPLDADNEIAPNALTVLGDALDAVDGDWDGDGKPDGHRLDIVYGALGAVEPDGKRYISDWPPKDFNYVSQISHRNQISSTAMFRRSTWLRVGGYRRRCRTAEDADFWCRATSMGGMAKRVSDAPLLVYYNRADSMSHIEKDWAWHDWYPWVHNLPVLCPVKRDVIEIPTFEPARVTVIIPVGPGHTELVIDAVDSLCAQNYERWNCIVVNDSGVDIPWIHPFVQVLSTGKKGGKGPAVARNIGIKAAKTQLFLLLDADDYLQPNAISSMVSAWKPGTYVYSDWIKQETGEIYRAPEWSCTDLVRKQPHSITILCEREAWSNVGGFDPKIELWEDWDFLLSLGAAGICGTRVPAALFQYRMAAGERREAAYASREKQKQAIADKWKKYVIDGEPLMACGGCGKKGSPVHSAFDAPPQTSSVQTEGSENGLVLLEFVGEGAPRTYRGSNGAVYRFGSDSSHKVKYVVKKDAEALLLRDEFKLASENPVEEKPALQAAGPPKR